MMGMRGMSGSRRDDGNERDEWEWEGMMGRRGMSGSRRDDGNERDEWE